MNSLLLVSELGHINDQIDTLIRLRASTTAPLVTRTHRRDVLAVRDAGALRLRAIAASLPAPAMDADYIQAGLVLREAAARLAPRLRERFPHSEQPKAASCCAAIAEGVLLASRHAADTTGCSWPETPLH